jgi:hypothetical protein
MPICGVVHDPTPRRLLQPARRIMAIQAYREFRVARTVLEGP